MAKLSIIDWSIWVVYFTLMLLVLVIYRSSKKDDIYSNFLPAFFIKVLGGIGFVLVYIYFYGFGDTFLYHKGAVVMADTLVDNPGDYFRLLFSGSADLPADLAYYSEKISYSNTYEEWLMVKLLSPVSFISFKSYLVTTLFMSLLSFFGGWKLYVTFTDILPKYKNQVFLVVFLVPSVIFWGGGIMKDTVTLFALNYLIYAVYFGFFKKRFSFRMLIIALLMIYIISVLKAYIVLAFLPGIFLGFYTLIKSRISNAILRFMVGPLLFVGLIGMSYVGLNQITQTSTKYQASNLTWQVKGFHSWHTDVGGSIYSLGDIEYTPSGIAQKIPAALNVTYFRPYVWEARNPVVLMGAIESFAFFTLFILVIWRLRLKVFKAIRENPLLYGLFIFCLIFGFAVGFTSYNFGALARYKIPVLSIFAFVFLRLYLLSKKEPDDKSLV